MSELRYPNESKAYRDAREALLKDEQELLDKVKAVAAKRRALPPGGRTEGGLRLPVGRRRRGRQETRRAREILRAVRRQEHAAALLMDVRPELGQAVPVLHVADGWVRSHLVLGRAGCRVRRRSPRPRPKRSTPGRRSAAGRRSRCCPATSRLIRRTTNARARPTTCSRRDASTFRKRDGKIFHFWGTEPKEPRRHGVAVLEPDGLHAGGPAGPAHAAAKVQAGVF